MKVKEIMSSPCETIDAGSSICEASELSDIAIKMINDSLACNALEMIYEPKRLR